MNLKTERKKSQSNTTKPDYHELSNETAYWEVATLTKDTGRHMTSAAQSTHLQNGSFIRITTTADLWWHFMQVAPALQHRCRSTSIPKFNQSALTIL